MFSVLYIYIYVLKFGTISSNLNYLKLVYMEQQPHAFRQAGVLRLGEAHVYFEVALRDAAAKIGRPPPKIRGYRQEVPEYSDRSWRVECTLRGRQVAPICDDIVFEVTARSWEDRLLR